MLNDTKHLERKTHAGTWLASRQTSRLLSSALTAFVMFTVAHTANAAQLVLYDFTSGNFSPDTVANTSASTFVNGLGLTGGSPTYFTPSSNGVLSDGILIRSTSMTTTETGAVSGNDYLSFTVTPDTGSILNFESLTFDLVGSDNSSPINNYVGEVAVRSSLDGFASTLAVFATTNAGAGAPDLGEWANVTLSLTGIDFQGVTTPLEFRLFLFSNANQVGDVTRFDNVILNGTVLSVSEPASLPLWALGVGVLLWATIFAKPRSPAVNE